MSEKKKKHLDKNQDDEVEKQLDTLWNNWASRRRCESTHIPEYVRKNQETKNN